MNELNFARFKAKLEQRVTELKAMIDTKVDNAVFQHAIAQLDAKIDRRASELQVALEKGLKEQTKFMFLAWSALLIPIIGLWFRG